ncbi:hypothetical protein SEUCBS140593_007787 [Sporothrix eucalyptigena]|uniref:Uncharacterized protein n=1 Tax=Sporothrix eucalyptigena TaxID=1812306 RepID=A0ABP0CG06_9PEZI
MTGQRERYPHESYEAFLTRLGMANSAVFAPLKAVTFGELAIQCSTDMSSLLDQDFAIAEKPEVVEALKAPEDEIDNKTDDDTDEETYDDYHELPYM